MPDILEGDGEKREPLPKQIGPYQISKKLGKGGMGVVLLGVRDHDQFHKRVAIKLIRRGIDTAQDGAEVLKRFDLERQVLGALNHPNIARLLDAGQMPEPDGRPYFVMEYVEGEPIDEYCDRMELGVEERLRLFQKVCAAVHHAHQNLVIHRDIKPANIFVDITGEPKLMDFGIVKLVNPAMAAVTLATSHDRGPMTPEYASPEQVQGKPISTSSDVYALGVLLYELLTGRRPYHLKSRAIDAMVRAICEDEPERPSTVVTHPETQEALDGSTRTRTADQLAKPREGAVTRLKRKLLGDVDNIVLKAMRKSPQRRYASAEALATDIQRHLAGDAVDAAPDSLVYRAGKFVRKNKAGVAAAALVVLALAAGGGVAAIGWQRARAAEKVAIAAKEHEALLARENLDLAGTYYKAIGDAVRRMEGATEARAELARVAVEQMERLAAARGDDPVVKRLLAQNYALVSDVTGGSRDSTKGNAAAAQAPLEKGLEIARGLAARPGATDEDRRLLAANLIRMGELRGRLPALGDPLESFIEAEKLARASGAGDLVMRRLLGQSLSARADVAMGREKPDPEAIGSAYQESLAIRSALVKESPTATHVRDYTVGLNRMAQWWVRQGAPGKAEEMYQEALRTREDALQREPNARTKHDVFTAAKSLGRFLLDDQGEGTLARARIAIQRERAMATDLAENDSDAARSTEAVCFAARDLGEVFAGEGKHHEAVRLRTEAVEHARSLVALGRSTVTYRWHLARSLTDRAESLSELKQRDEARAALLDAKTVWDGLAAEDPTAAIYRAGAKECDKALEALRG